MGGRKSLFLLDNDGRLADQFQPITQKTLEFTHSSSVTGPESFTGFGFMPGHIKVTAIISGGPSISHGIGEDGVSTCMRFDNGIWFRSSSKIIDLVDATNKEIAATLTSLDADGFTLDWTNTNLPTFFTRLTVHAIK